MQKLQTFQRKQFEQAACSAWNYGKDSSIAVALEKNLKIGLSVKKAITKPGIEFFENIEQCKLPVDAIEFHQAFQ